MRFTCSRTELLAACQLVKHAIPTRTTKPIYHSIKAIVDSDFMTLMSTDLNIGMRSELPVQTEAPGEAMLQADKFIAILKECNDLEVAIEADERRVFLTTARSKFKLASEPPESFSDVPRFEGEWREVGGAQLRDMLRRTDCAAGIADAEWSTSPISFEFGEDELRLIGTNTKLLVVASGQSSHGAATDLSKKYLVPPKAISILLSVVSKSPDQFVRISLSSKDASFQVDNTTIHTRLQAGAFPPWRKILHTKVSSCEVEVASLLSLTRQARLMTDEFTTKAKFSFSKDALRISTSNAELGESDVEMPIELIGPAVDIWINPNYAVDYLATLKQSKVDLSLENSLRPMKLQSENSYCLIIPMTPEDS